MSKNNARRIGDWFKNRIQIDRDNLTESDRKRLNRASRSVERPVKGLGGHIRRRSVQGREMVRGRVQKARRSLLDGTIGRNPRRSRKKRSRVT